jgi:hypothetical protein
VPDHRIRLRRGWEYGPVGSHAGSRRLTLPTRWGSEQPGRLLLTRRFGCPPRGPGRQGLILLLEQVPGVHSIRLNEQEIPEVSPARSRYEIRLDDLPSRNVLVLEVELPMAQGRTDTRGGAPGAGGPTAAGWGVPADGQGPEGSSEWGFIALVIHTPSESQDPTEPA